MRPTFRLRFEHDNLSFKELLLGLNSASSHLDRRNRPDPLKGLELKPKIQKEREYKSFPSFLNRRFPFSDSQIVRQRTRVIQRLEAALLRRWGSQGLSLVDVSLTNYASPTTVVPVELAMVDNYIPTTSSCSPWSIESAWNAAEPRIRSHPMHSARSVGLALRKWGFGGEIYDLRGVPSRTAKHGTMQLPTTRFPDFAPEINGHVSFLISSDRGYTCPCPVILTLPSPYVLPRFNLLRRIYQEPHAQKLLASVWDWKRIQRLRNLTPTAIAIMTGSFLQLTHDPISTLSPIESFASFLRHCINHQYKDEIISVGDPEQLLQSSLTRQTSDSTVAAQSLLEQLRQIVFRSPPLTIRDPYILMKNHAEHISLKQLFRFAFACQDTLKRIDAGETLHAILEVESKGKIASDQMSPQTQDVGSAPDAVDLESLYDKKDKPSAVLASSSTATVSEDAPISCTQSDSEPSPVSVEVTESNVPPASLTLPSPKEKEGKKNVLKLLTKHESKISGDRLVSSNRHTSLEDQETPSAHRLIYPSLRRADQEQLAWHVPGYEEYESAFVDEAYTAEMFSPSSQPSQSQSVKSPSVTALETEIVSSSEKVEDSLVDTTASLGSDLDLEAEDATFLAEILANATAAEKRQGKVLSILQCALKEKYGRSYRLESFGSSRYGITTESSDLDLVILDPSMKEGYKPGAKPLRRRLYDTYHLSRWLSDVGFKVLDHIPQATVPIVKFLDKKTGLHCDINVNERLGLLNTDLLAAYCRISPLLGPMLLLIKLWAKPRGLNTPASQTRGPVSFSSYALALMTVNFLQTRGLLPNLQANLPSSKRGGVYYARRKSKVVECDVRYHSDISEIEGWEPSGSPSLRMILADWFAFWAREFSSSNSIVSIRHGQVLRDASKNNEGIRVLDPFIVDKNVAVSITRKVYERFRSECELATKSLRQETPLRKLTEVSRMKR